MELNERARMALFASALVAMFTIGIGAAACVMGSRPAQRPPGVTPEPNLVVGYARVHPDPAIIGAFADKLQSGEIKVLIEKPKEHAMASFGQRGDGYVLTLDPARLKAEPTLEEYEGVLSILSHEHAHYRQFVEGEMINYNRRGGPMTEAQCTLTILVEIDAHGKACRDAREYRWETSVATGACRRTTASIAEYFLTERLDTYPECKGVWEFYAERGKTEAEPKPLIRKVGPPKRRSGAVYLPPS